MPSPTVDEIAQALELAFEQEIAARNSGITTRQASLLPVEIRSACAAIMESDSDPTRLVALTLCAAKAGLPRVNVQHIQAGDMDFRSRYGASVLPVLTRVVEGQQVSYRPSSDPFVSNPYREEWLDDAWVARRRQGANRLVGSHLVRVVGFIEQSPDEASDVLAELVAGQLDRFSRERIAYQVPTRATISLVVGVVEEFLETSAGGTRLERIAVALLRFVGMRFSIWDEVIGHHGNDSLGYDAQCLLDGGIAALAESKDQTVTVEHLRQLAEEMRSCGASRGFLFTRGGHLASQASSIEEFIERRHLLGQRMVALDVIATVQAWLALSDQQDEDIPMFIRLLCEELDQWADLTSRRAWATLLADL